jgi:[CysO sulfur-carrier protein]-S-L-cysteine hydrolase
MHSLILPKEQLQTMIDHVSRHAPLEACGLLAGVDSTVRKIFLVQNQAYSAVRFVMDPVGQLNAFAWIEAHGMDLLGIFHSHPTGPETVSPTDVAEAAYAVVHVILAPRNKSWQARGFWIKDNDYNEVELQIT